MARTFSLCQTVKHSKKNNLILIRLGDIIGDELCEFVPSEQYGPEHTEERRFQNPYISPSNSNHQINELRIWEWDPDGDSKAKNPVSSFYELSASIDLMLDNKDYIIAKMKSGFSIPEYNGQKLLIKIRETNEVYMVLAIDSSKFSVVNGIAKINKNIPSVKGYYLKKEEFINTERATAYSAEGERLPVRYVYKNLTLQEHEFELETNTFVDKLALLINKQLKLKGFSRKETKAAKEIFLESLDRYNEIKEFFDENGFNGENLNVKIEEVKAQIQDVLSENNQYDIFCERMIEGLPSLTEKFELQVKKNWLQKHKAECGKAQQEIDSLIGQKDASESEFRIQKEKVILLQDEASIIENKIKDMTDIQENLQTSLIAKIVDIKSNISEFFSEAVLYQSLLGVDKSGSLPHINEAEEINKSKEIIQLFSEKLKTEVEVINSTEDMISVLGINLEMAGILKDIFNNLAQYISASITQKTPLLLVGYGSRNIADAISATICGMSSDVITLTAGFDNYETLSKMIFSCKSKVILIENAIGYIDETIYMQILKETPLKTILFGLEFSEQLNFIPKSILNYVNLLCLDDICERKTQSEYNGAIINDDILVFVKDSKGLRINKDSTVEVSKLIGMPKIYNSFRAELLTTMDCYYKPSAMFAWLIFEVVPYMVSIGKNQEASQLVSNKELNDQQNNLLLSLIKSEDI